MGTALLFTIQLVGSVPLCIAAGCRFFCSRISYRLFVSMISWILQRRQWIYRFPVSVQLHFFPLACMHWNHTVAFWGHNFAEGFRTKRMHRTAVGSCSRDVVLVHERQSACSAFASKPKSTWQAPSLSFFSAWQSHGWTADIVHSPRWAISPLMWTFSTPTRHGEWFETDALWIGFGPYQAALETDHEKVSSSVATLSFALRSKGEGGQPVTWLFRRWPVIFSNPPPSPNPPLHAPHAP